MPPPSAAMPLLPATPIGGCAAARYAIKANLRQAKPDASAAGIEKQGTDKALARAQLPRLQKYPT